MRKYLEIRIIEKGLWVMSWDLRKRLWNVELL